MYRHNENELRRAMDRVERWFGEHVAADFFDAGVRAVDGVLGPLLSRWNGQLPEDVAFYEGFYLLDREGVAREKAMMDQLAADERWPDTWWSRDWVPFGTDLAGQLLVVDCRSGRVIEFLHDDDARPEHGESLAAFLAAYADALEAGERRLHNGYITEVAELERYLEEAPKRAAEQRRTHGVLLSIGGALLALVAIAALIECA